MFGTPRFTPTAFRRLYASKSPHAHVYTSLIPAMVPVFLLGSAVYLGLELTQLKLSHEKYMTEAANRIDRLESEIAALQEKRTREQNTVTTVNPPSRRWW